MKVKLLLLIIVSIWGCNNPASQKRNVKFVHPINVKIASIQACLDTANVDYPGTWPRLLIIKTDNDTIGLERLHLGSNKMTLDTLPKGLDLRYYPHEKTTYIRIKYAQ